MRAFRLLPLAIVLAFVGRTWADAPRVLPEGKLPADRRLGELKHLNAYFPFQVPQTATAWEARADSLRRRILVSTGLWPLPERTPLNAKIHGKIKRQGFTVERVYFESVPGFYVTGLLYRPTGFKGKRPAVLSPHGHGGRLQDLGRDGVKSYIAKGAEKYEKSGRYPKLARCVQLARMGCVVFIFDMIGYADSVQISRQLAHGFAKQRPKLEGEKTFGLFSAQAEMRSLSIFGLQTWSCIRGLDFLCSLPEVDKQRIGVTGGSGGGTQTIVLGAVDPRPVVSFPQGMVSTAMQGGCTCENSSLLRIGTGNVELAALFAPKPLAMTAANDWTKDMMTKGFPELKRLYTMLGVADQVDCKPFLHFPHNYNYVTRGIMYEWFNRYLKLGLKSPIVEKDSEPLAPAEYTVWNDKHPKPRGGVEFEVKLMRYLAKASDQQLAALAPKDKASLQRYRQVVGAAWKTILNRELLAPQDIERTKISERDRGDYLEFADLVRVPKFHEQLPVVSFYPKKTKWNEQVVIWIDGRGKTGMFNKDGRANAEVLRLLSAGFSVIGADLVYQGEFLKDGIQLRQARRVNNPREYAGFTLGYNDPLFVQRVHDVLTLITFASDDEHGAKQTHLLGVEGAGPIVAAAQSISGDKVTRVALDTAGFRFRKIRSIRDLNFVPAAVKYGDIDSLLALAAPRKLWISGEGGELPQRTAQAFAAAGGTKPVSSTAPNAIKAAVDWLIK